METTIRSAIAVVLAAVIGGVAMSNPAATAAQATPEASPAATLVGPSAAIPETPPGDQLRWLLDKMNDDPSTLTDEEIEEHFADAFLGQVPVDQVRDIFIQFAAAAPWAFVSVTEEQRPNVLVAVISSSQGALLVTIVVEPAEPHKMTGLLFEAAPAASWDEVDAALTAIGPQVSFRAAEVTDAGCHELHGINPEQWLAIGSTFKLYVLGELARQVAAREAAWDELLPIQERYKSLPSGNFRNTPEGTEFTLRYYAEVMISQSDNTATDHLIARLGRENVGAMMATMGHGDSSVNVPLLMTRDLFVIKLSLTEEERQAYLAATPEERRSLLDTEIADAELPGLDLAATFTEPLLIDELEWFASAQDLCAAIAYLYQQGQQPELRPVLEIMALSAPLSVDGATWPIVLFKGGSEPGVLNVTFLLVRNDGRAFVLTASVNSPDGQVDANAGFAAVQGAVGPLAQAP